MKFVHHANTRQLLTELDLTVKRYWVRTLVGQRGTGKSRLIEEWIAGGSGLLRPHEVLKIDLWNAELESWGLEDGSYASACLAFTLLWGELAKRLAVHDGGYPTFTLSEPKKVYKKSQFASLFRVVKEAVDTFRPRAIIIDNASYLDAFALDRLMDIRNRRFPRCALILCARLERHATPDEPLKKLFRSTSVAHEGMTDAEAAYIPDPLVMQQLTEAEFYEIVVEALLNNVEATITEAFIAELLAGDVLERLWQRVNLDWRIITRIETLMDYRLGPQERVMTMDVINWVLEQL